MFIVSIILEFVSVAILHTYILNGLEFNLLRNYSVLVHSLVIQFRIRNNVSASAGKVLKLS
jgi:hypothetical protein